MTTGNISLVVDVLFLTPVAALILGFFVFHQRYPRQTHWPMLVSCAAVSAASLFLAWAVRSTGSQWDMNLYDRWLAVVGFGVDFGIRVDALSADVLAMVCVVGSIIHCYAVGYMRDDPGFSRFFLYFHLFLLSMIGLVLSNNY